MGKILICGDRSFVAKGLINILNQEGYDTYGFSRGDIDSKNGNLIRGDVFNIDKNQYLDEEFDVVINFIIIKDGTIEDNISYIKSLEKFCINKNVKNLIQISSISVYPNNLNLVNEDTEIETDIKNKGKYASIKVAIDNYLLSQSYPFNITFVRPGYVYSKDRISSDGILKRLPLNINILLGDNKTSLPIIDKEVLHQAIVKIINKKNKEKVYLIFENNNFTKYKYAKYFLNKSFFKLPKHLIITFSKILCKTKIISKNLNILINGLFKDTHYDSYKSEYKLGMSFTKGSILIIGAGAYGSYTINALINKGIKPYKITLIDVGNSKIKSEDQIGYETNILGNQNYSALNKGRYFGYGGASDKWGGQLLLFSKNDFNSPSKFLNDIIDCNIKHKELIFSNFKIKNKFVETFISKDLFTKTGVWLGYFNRNLFKYFKINKKDINIISNQRVKNLIITDKKVLGCEIISKDGETKHLTFEQYFLCAGAFESNRILLSSKYGNNKINFSDHLSQKIFEVIGSPKIGNENYQFKLDGTSLITKRIIGEIDGVSYFANPIYNSEFPFFQNIKKLLFKKEINYTIIKSILTDIPSVLKFAWDGVVNHKISVYKNKWHIFIDIENPTNESFLSLSTDKDKWGINKLNIEFIIPPKANKIYEEAKQQIKQYLDENNINYIEILDKIHAEKAEDTYHPYGMILSNSESLNDFFSTFSNMLVINTGILPRAGGINNTAACFPIIEEYIKNINL